MADNALSRVDSYQYPAAHLGHLTEGQQSALDKFKKLCQEQGYYHPAGEQGRSVASHDDETLLRYLRARKFTPEEALKQFKDTEDWRKENHLEELYDTIDVKEYEETRRLYPQWTGRRDKRGIPVYLFEVAHLDSKAINAYQNSISSSQTVAHNASKVPTKMLRLFALYENLTRFVLPLCSAIKDRPHPETPVSQSNNIVDISNVGLRQFWNLKNHMQDASQLATAYYPETLDRIFIIGAPSFFPTVWSWIKRWFDPITVSKIFILSSTDMKSTLEKYIDPENIPKKYGGKLDFEFGMMPVLGPSIANSLKWNDSSAPDLQKGEKTIPTGPIKWRESSSGRMEAFAVGKENEKLRERAIATIETTFQGMHGVSRTNTAIDWSAEKVQSTPGTATQPKEEGDPFYGADLSSGTVTPQPGNGTNTPRTMSNAAVGSAVANNSATLPARPAEDGSSALPPSNTQPRTGTSDTRLEQQDATHASDQPSTAKTPHTIHYGHGDKAVTMEPATVGQAPKDISANLPQPEDPPAPSYIQQAQTLASQTYSKATETAGAAVGAMASTVGIGKEGSEGAGEKEREEVGGKESDEKVDATEDKNVEEFLRSKYPSTTAGGKDGKV